MLDPNDQVHRIFVSPVENGEVKGYHAMTMPITAVGLRLRPPIYLDMCVSVMRWG